MLYPDRYTDGYDDIDPDDDQDLWEIEQESKHDIEHDGE